MFKLKFNRLSRNWLVLLILSTTLWMQGCFWEDDDPAPLPNQDASGIYTGTAQLGGTGYNDLKGIIHNNRLMIFSITAHVLYDGTINSISSDNFTASVNVYVNGLLDAQSPVEVTGKVMSASHFNVTFANTGTGKVSGSFELTYDSVYERVATLDRVSTYLVDNWDGVLKGSTDISSSGIGFGNDSTFSFSTDGIEICQTISPGATVTFASQVNVYLLSAFDIEEVINCPYLNQIGRAHV